MSFKTKTLLAASMVMAMSAPAFAEGVLNIYNWSEYIGETTLADFEAATGIKPVYDLYASAEEMQAKMLAGSTGYDVVDMSGMEMPRFIKAGIYQKLDRAKLPLQRRGHLALRRRPDRTRRGTW